MMEKLNLAFPSVEGGGSCMTALRGRQLRGVSTASEGRRTARNVKADKQAVTTVGLVVCLIVALPGCARKLPPDRPPDLETALLIRSHLEEGASAVGSGAGSAKQLAEPTGWATLKGSFRISGTPPERKPLKIDKDMAVCAPGGKSVLSQEVVIGGGNGIADVLIYLSTDIPGDDPKWIHNSYDATKEEAVEFDQKNCIFLSHVFAMRTTQTLRILNSDPVGHNTKFDPQDGSRSFNQIIPANSPYEYGSPLSAERSPVPVSCSIHPWMTASMIFRDNPYFTVSNADGIFEIVDLPAGVELEYRVWQDRATSLKSATVNGERQTWSKGRFTLQLEPGEVRQLDIVIDAAEFKS
jgi:hypothetical protein